MATTSGRSGTILTVQYLRGIACLAVVLFHGLGGSDGPFYVGQAGVDVFFLISGFIMWTVTERREQAPVPFLVRRLIRIVPLYWAVTLLVFPRRYLIGTATLADLGHSLSFIPHLMSDGTTNPLIVPGWTLDYEMFFYVVFAACLLISVRHRLAVAAVLLTALVAVGVAFRVRSVPWYAYTDPLLLEFLAGVALGWLAARMGGDRPILGVALVAAGLGVLGAEQVGSVHLGEWRALLFGGPALALLSGSLCLERAVPELGWLKGLGDASYAIYLVHVPIMSLLLKLTMPLAARVAVVLALSIGVGWCLHLADAGARRVLRGRSGAASLST